MPRCRRARASTMNYAVELDLDGYVKALARRSTILREWLLFFERYPLLLMPVCWERPFPIDFDQQGDAAVRRMMDAHHPMLAVSVLGLPGLSVPTGLAEGVPVGVQLVAGRFQEETCLAAGEVLEARTAIRLPIEPGDPRAGTPASALAVAGGPGRDLGVDPLLQLDHRGAHQGEDDEAREDLLGVHHLAGADQQVSHAAAAGAADHLGGDHEDDRHAHAELKPGKDAGNGGGDHDLELDLPPVGARDPPPP